MKNHQRLIDRIQHSVRASQIDGWLFCGFLNMDPIAARILHMPPEQLATRRWFYLVPAHGNPSKLVHRIESHILGHLPGSQREYLSWQQLASGLKALLAGCPRVAMQYSPENAIPYVSRVDAGTVELVRASGSRVVSSADLVQHFESVLDPRQLEQHRAAAARLTTLVRSAFQAALDRITSRGGTDELALQEFILRHIEQEGLVTEHAPIVAVNENSADPHYQPGSDRHSSIHAGDFVLIDLWAKTPEPGSVYADITWTAFLGCEPPPRLVEIFNLVRKGRDRGVEYLRRRYREKAWPQGWEVDDAVRRVIREGGYESCFVHRTGHNLGGDDLHGNGVHFDNLETHDTRRVVPGLCCTIEPGIYLPGEFGVRSEINIYLREDGPEITTPPQDELLLLEV